MSSETLALIGLFVATAAVVYQARAYYLSRQELTLKVEDLSSLVHRLETEVAARIALDRKHTDLMVASLNGDAQALNHATQLSGIILDSMRGLDQSIHGVVVDIQNILIVHNALVTDTGRYEQAQITGLAVAVDEFCRARIAQIACVDEWQREGDDLRQRHLATASSDELVAAKERVRFETETAAYLLGKYEARLRALNLTLISSRERFLTSANTTFSGRQHPTLGQAGA